MSATATPAAPDRRASWRWLVAAVVAVAVLVVAVAFFWRRDNQGDGAARVPSGTTATVDATAPATLTDAEAATVVWPAPGDGRYGQPAEAVRSFAEDLVGFTSPTIGEFREGDSRSGEVDVAATAAGPVTTVFVRHMSDGYWYVTGSAAGFTLDDPVPGTAIDHPLTIAGRGSTPIDEVRVAVYARGSTTALGEAVVPTTSADHTSFKGEVAWNNPGGGWGVVVATTARNGEVAQAVALPVGFIGGD